MKALLYVTISVSILLATSPAPVAAIDDAKIAAAGIRKLPGKRLTLYTDLTGKEIDALPGIFEQAFPQWCDYFRVDEKKLPNWRMTGFLMKDKVRFVAAGLLPKDLPPFEHGFSRDDVLWLYEQPSDYYRRHLLLHEGTHGFMNTVLGGCGPLWYMEGMAEYLATHRWRDGRLTLGYMPRSRDESPQWGRIRILQDAAANRRALSLKTVTEFEPSPRRENDLYAWCWAAATLLDGDPRYRQRFRELAALVQRKDFQKRFHESFDADWPTLSEQWQWMVAHLEYGYDVARCAIDFTPGKPFDAPASVTIAADRGWQNTGLRLEAGKKYRLTASGRYQVARSSARSSADRSTIWWCEPNGVSIRYHQGRPLGVLLAAVLPDHRSADDPPALLQPIVVGLGATLTPATSGTLFLRVNDSPGELDDNAGELKVEIVGK